MAPKPRGTYGPDSEATAGFAALLGKALGHPVRIEIATFTDEDRVSPKGMARRLSEGGHAGAVGLGTLSYHFRELRGLNVLRPAGTEPRRGAIEHFYALSPIGERVLAALQSLSERG